jgi:hypothetical protein
LTCRKVLRISGYLVGSTGNHMRLRASHTD